MTCPCLQMQPFPLDHGKGILFTGLGVYKILLYINAKSVYLVNPRKHDFSLAFLESFVDARSREIS